MIATIDSDKQFRINEVLSLIHGNLAGDLGAANLADYAAYSEQYFHRVFKQVTGETVHKYIRRVRLESAANQLLFTPDLTVAQIALNCGFESLSSFTRAFKTVYRRTPGQWRATPSPLAENIAPPFLDDLELKQAYKRTIKNQLPDPEIIQLAPMTVAYIRHRGYGRDIANTWQTLHAWATAEQRPFETQIGLHHSNPAITPLAECHYVACVGIDKPVTRRGNINSVIIPGGLHAAFTIAGRYGDLLPMIHKITYEWLPESDFVAQTTPAFAIYEENQFLKDADDFKLKFYLPIKPLWLV